jgi:hypothetical protein
MANNMMNKMSANINQKNFLYLVIYGGIIFIIILVGILPLYLKASNSVKENEKIKYQIKEQKDFGPVYATLLNAMNNKYSLVLPNPEKKPVPRAEAGKFQDDFRVIVKKSGLMIVSFIPDLNTAVGSSTVLLHNIVLKGELADFRKMLIGLGAVPYLDRIEEISCQQGTDRMEFKMKVWIALK